jgi:hypothetical protein
MVLPMIARRIASRDIAVSCSRTVGAAGLPDGPDATGRDRGHRVARWDAALGPGAGGRGRRHPIAGVCRLAGQGEDEVVL